MPLIQSKSKKALQKNIKTEMEAHPGPSRRDQNLAIAYAVKRRNSGKKMADGGAIKKEKYDHESPSCMKEGGMCYSSGGHVPPCIHHSADLPEEIKRDKYKDGGDIPMGSSEEKSEQDQGYRVHPEWDMLDTKADDENADYRDYMDSHDFAEGGEIHDDDHSPELQDEGEDHELTEHELLEHEAMEHMAEEEGDMIDRIIKRRKMRYAEGGQVDLEENSKLGHYNPKLAMDKSVKDAAEHDYDEDFDHMAEPKDNEKDMPPKSEYEDEDVVSRVRRKMRAKR